MAYIRPGRATNENGTPGKAADVSKAPAKRGRGRSPKNGIAPKPNKEPFGRSRGRPKRTGSGVKKSVAKKPTVSSGPGRRGRPAKAASVTTTPNKVTILKASLTKPETKSSATKGHKPQKSDAAEEPEEDSVETREIGALHFPVYMYC
ncbi:hypothetical protein F4782DRAFT_551151 [Xylaria castorea]|nr:hypothetical protein F4782DRAFT_551151 [Xylaria castorea]